MADNRDVMAAGATMHNRSPLARHLSGYRVVLASQSPRRVELLTSLDIPFEQCVISGIDESYPDALPLVEVPEYIACHKASAYRAQMREDTLLIAADTVVLVEDKLLGKPYTREEAIAMLELLSGRGHRVVTGVCITSSARTLAFSSVTEVYFSALSCEDIEYYIDKYQPYDKAGAYGIQEWIGSRAMERVVGSFYNVMGLPVQQLAEALLLF